MSSQGTSHRNAWEHAAPYRQATARFVVLGVCHRSPSLVGSTTESRLINADGNLWSSLRIRCLDGAMCFCSLKKLRSHCPSGNEDSPGASCLDAIATERPSQERHRIALRPFPASRESLSEATTG